VEKGEGAKGEELTAWSGIAGSVCHAPADGQVEALNLVECTFGDDDILAKNMMRQVMIGSLKSEAQMV